MFGVPAGIYVAFIVLFIISRIITTKLDYRDENKSEVKSMKTRTMSEITNVLSSSLEVMRAIGVNILSACLLA